MAASTPLNTTSRYKHLLTQLGNSGARKREKHLVPRAPCSEDTDTGWKHGEEGTCLPGTAPRCRRMDPVLLGRTVRFHPCLFEGWHRRRHSQCTFPNTLSAKLPCWALLRSGATKRMDLGILPWKWFRFPHRKTTPVGVGIHFSTMHCYMAIFLFHYPPVFLL